MNKKQIINYMKNEMDFLRRYTKQLRIQNAMYGDANLELEANDDIVNYLTYTKSIIAVDKTPRMRKEPAFEAMKRKEAVLKYIKERDCHAYMLLKAIHELKEEEKHLLIDVYIRNLSRKVILYHQGDIVESTYYRRLDRALLNLYELIKNA